MCHLINISFFFFFCEEYVFLLSSPSLLSLFQIAMLFNLYTDLPISQVEFAFGSSERNINLSCLHYCLCWFDHFMNFIPPNKHTV